MMKHLLRSFMVVSLVFAVSCPGAWAQATGQISGVIKDQVGALLPGVEVAATNVGTGTTRSVVSNETGSYVLPGLPTGQYRLEAALPGFQTAVRTGIQLEVNSNLVIDMTLQVGQVTQTIEVQASTVTVETRSQGVGQVMENARILELPLNGRNVIDLIVLSGGAVQASTQNSRTEVGNSPVVSVSGGLGFANDYRLDGAAHLNVTMGTSMPMPFPDALQEFKVETSGLTAENGSQTAVGAVTKSGTNEFHGSLFEFVRNDLFNARNFRGEESTLKRNQFGGTIGGPIVQNKLFFFTGLQGTTLRSDPANLRVFIPTAAMMAGDWTAFAACGNTLRGPFVNNRIDPARFDPIAVEITSRVLANAPTPDQCGEVRIGRRETRNEWQLASRLDYQISDSNSMFGRILFTKGDDPNPFVDDPSNLLISDSEGHKQSGHSYAVGMTNLFGPSLVHQARLGFNRVVPRNLSGEFFDPCDVGMNFYCGYNPGVTTIRISGGFNLGAPRPVQGDGYISTSYELSDSVSWIRGNHQFSFGGKLALGRYNADSVYLSSGWLRFSPAGIAGNGLGNFLLGDPFQVHQGAPTAHYARQWWAAMYANDTWRASQRVTLNYGVRWEPYLPQSIPNGQIYAFDEDRFLKGIRTTQFTNAPAGFYYPGDPGFPGLSGVNKQWWNFSPRVGLAWDVAGDGRTSVRASYSLSYAYLPLELRIDAGRAYPWGGEGRHNPGPGSLRDPWATFPGGNPHPVIVTRDAPFAQGGIFQTLSTDVKQPRASSWNLSLQRDLAGFLVSGNYLGSTTIHVVASRPVNPSIHIPGLGDSNGNCFLNGQAVSFKVNPGAACSTTGNTEARRRLTLINPLEGSKIGVMTEYDDGATQLYHGLLLSAQRRATNGVTFNANYTWSHCWGDFADTNVGVLRTGITYQDMNDRSRDRGNCFGDRRHVFNLSGVFETPQFAGNTARLLASGWRLATIYKVSSGTPLTVISSVDYALSDVDNQRPDLVMANPYLDRSGRPDTQWFNPSAFAVPAAGNLGTMGRNNVVGPNRWDFDLALSRVFNVRESQRVEFRAEAFNVLNSFRPEDPIMDVTNANFGKITESRDPRIMQFVLKYIF
jgi:hypothetical protein